MKNVGAMVWSTVCPVFVETPPDIFEEAQTRLSATRHVDIKLKSHLQAVHALLLAVSGGGASRLWRDELPLAMFDQLRNRLLTLTRLLNTEYEGRRSPFRRHRQKQRQ